MIEGHLSCEVQSIRYELSSESEKEKECARAKSARQLVLKSRKFMGTRGDLNAG